MKIPMAMLMMTALSMTACSRATSVYPDAAETSQAITPVSTDDGPRLPKDFYNQSVNQAVVDLQLDGTIKTLRFQTMTGTNAVGGFNGTGVGNRATLGLGSWHSRPLNQAEPITFETKVFNGGRSLTVQLQIDLKCDGTNLHVVKALDSAIAQQATSSQSDGYTRFNASLDAAIWTSPDAEIKSGDGSTTVVPSNGTGVPLAALKTAYPAACLKNAATSASDLARKIPTAAVLWSLGDDSTSTLNSVYVRRLSVGAEVFEGLE